MLMENAGVGGQEMDPEIGILYRDISQFKDTEIPKAIELIQAVAREINGELAAKGHSGGHMGKLDFRRTIARDWKPAAAFTACATGRSAPNGSVWCCCAMCPAPWCSFRNLPCGSSRA